MPEQKKKVVINWDNGESIIHLILTESQIRLFDWLIDNDFIDCNRVTIDILEEQQEWEEV
jgi:hypothetical protein